MSKLSTLLSVVALLLATGWLALSDQVGVPLSVPEYLQQLRQLRSPASPPPAVSQTSPYAVLEQAAHDRVNQYRRQRGLPPLTLDARISQIARQHSADMASGRVSFGHAGFEQRVQTIARSIPYRQAGENVAYNQGYRDSVAQAVEGWINSPGHRASMEGNFQLTGMGIVRTADSKYYFTQIFIRRLL